MHSKPTFSILHIIAFLLLAPLLFAGAVSCKSASQQQKNSTNELISAATAGDAKAVQDALAAGADVNAKEAGGITPLMYAARGERPNQQNPVATDHPEVVRLLLKHGADPNAATDTGFVALMWAARYGHEQSVKALIDGGANVNAKDKDGLTSLKWAQTNHDAAPASYDKVIALLKDAGAKE